MTHNQVKIGCDRSGTPNYHKNTSKTVTSRNIDCPFRLYAREYSKSITWTLTVKNPEHSHDATENYMAHPTLINFNNQDTSQISQMSELFLMPRKIQAQLRIQREAERSLILQDISKQGRPTARKKSHLFSY
ncbi:hypothetical protein O181_011309 [Austropuccinia psidii MF-1]|uniref:FAR1 domain-containing protein n=1 Tax=Austropuccinia psidii MF-1 TaxID=1389203 RepID=A0A9Q3GLQ9_9BASI|nr:hypothetical protein [Austropuccinia psidii MF-1]